MTWWASCAPQPTLIFADINVHSYNIWRYTVTGAHVDLALPASNAGVTGGHERRPAVELLLRRRRLAYAVPLPFGYSCWATRGITMETGRAERTRLIVLTWCWFFIAAWPVCSS